jgi:Xaa-Pro aminopeptidase
MTSVHVERRARLAAQLGAGAVAIIPTAPARPRNRDSDYLYRHDSYFFYLTGFTEPHAWLVITGDGRSTLLCQPKDLEREIWDGIRLGPESAPAALGVDEAHSVDELNRLMPVWLENRTRVWFPFASHEGLESQVEGWLRSVRAKIRQGVSCPSELMDVCAPLDEMRLVKDAHELATMRRACDISAAAHIRAMQTSARRLRAGQDLREFHLDAELLHGFREAGSQYPAYGSIVAGGANACVLHYRADTAPIRDGDLVLIDAGCELDGYASDITRTFPANGRFTGPQRTLYDIVLAAQTAAVNATRVGARFVDPHNAAVAVLAQGMLDVGLLDRNTAGTVDDVIEHRRYTPFYMHRTGHWLGMDVHDCGAYTEVNAGGERVSKTLQAGMVLTIEPGLYVRPAENVPEAFWNIGIRIEDDAVVTASGCELISRGVPVDADAIETLMRA